MIFDLSKNRSQIGLQEKLLRAIWCYFCEPLVRWLPRRMSFLRIFFLRVFGAKIGDACLIDFGVIVLKPWSLSMGNQSVLGAGVNVYNHGRIFIGDNSIISQDVYLCGGTHDFRREDFPLVSRDVCIGSGCWIAAKSFIHPGVSIGDNSILGACSVLHKSIGEGEIWAGNPAKFISIR